MAIPFRPQIAPILRASELNVPVSRGALQQDCARPGTPNEHSCGNCHACCVYLWIPAGEVSEKAKPAGAVCPNLSSHGCLIYQDRPNTCRKFQCVWLNEPSWPLQWRPERCGLLYLREEIHDGVPAAVVYETERGAMGRPTAEEILSKLKESTAVIVVVNLRQERQLIRGDLWADPGEVGVRRPHFLRPLGSLGRQTESAETRREAS